MSDNINRPGRFAYEGLQRAFHEKARLGIMTCLVSEPDGLSFASLKELCALSDGNLNRHLEVLRESGFVRIEKQGAGRGSKSTCFVTPSGRQGFLEYLEELERVIGDATQRAATQQTIDSSSRLDIRTQGT